MRILRMWLKAEVLEELLDMGQRRITGAQYDMVRDAIALDIADPAAPDGTLFMEPRYQGGPGERMKMSDPGYRS